MKKVTTAKPSPIVVEKKEPVIDHSKLLTEAVERLVKESGNQQQSLVEKILLLVEAVSKQKPQEPQAQPKKLTVKIERDKNGNLETLHIERAA